MQRGASIVSAIGGLLIAASIVAPAFGAQIPTFVPGFILLFVGRAMNRNRRRAPIPTSQNPAPAPPQRSAPPPQPSPRTVEPAPRPPVQEEPERRNLEEVLEELAQDSDSESVIDVAIPEIELESGPLSSAERIAQARSRWDKRP